MTSKSTHITAGATMSSLMIPLIWLSFIDDPQVYEDGAFLGPFWGLFSAAIVLIVAMFRSERWNVLAAIVSLNWIIYTFGRLNDLGVSGFPNALTDDGSYPMILWLLITFWSNVGVIILASRGHLGAMAPQGTITLEEMVAKAQLCHSGGYGTRGRIHRESGLERDSCHERICDRRVGHVRRI